MSVVREHHRDHRRVEVVVEHALGEPDAGEDQADLAAGKHPEPDDQPVAHAAEQAEAGHELADRRDRHEAGDEQQEARVGERARAPRARRSAGRTPG